MTRSLSTILVTLVLLRASSAFGWIATLHGGPSDPSEARSVAVDGNGDVLAAGGHPNAVKLDGATGGPIWTQSFDDAFAFGIATSSGGAVLVAGGVQGPFGGWEHFYAILDGATGDGQTYVKVAPLSNVWLAGALFAPPQNPVVYGNRGAAYVAMNNVWQRELAPHVLNGFASGRIEAAVADAAGNVIAAGRSDGLIIDQFGRLAFDRPHLLAAKLAAADGATIWQHVIDEASEATSVSLDTNGDVLIAGVIASAASAALPDDMLALKLSGADGSELWRREIDGSAGSANDAAFAVRADANGDAIVAGRLTLTPSDPLFKNGLAEFTVVKLAGADGSETWRYGAPNTTLAPDILPGVWGGTKGEGRAIAFDADGDPVVTGVTNASWFESGPTGHVADFTVVKLSDADGSQRWLFVPGAGQARSIAEAPDGIVVAGHLNRETPDTLQVTYEYPGFACVYENRTGTGLANPFERGGGITFQGTKATMYVDRSMYKIVPERNSNVEAVEVKATDSGNANHWKNFLECVKTRQRPNSDIEICYKSTTTCLLGNIALRSKMRVDWDVAKDTIVQAEPRKYMVREYRKPWKLVV